MLSEPEVANKQQLHMRRHNGDDFEDGGNDDVMITTQ